MADILQRDFSESRLAAERIAPQLVGMLGATDPMESLYALSLVTSHLISMVGTGGDNGAYMRVQPMIRGKMMTQVLELCREARAAGAN